MKSHIFFHLSKEAKITGVKEMYEIIVRRKLLFTFANAIKRNPTPAKIIHSTKFES